MKDREEPMRSGWLRAGFVTMVLTSGCTTNFLQSDPTLLELERGQVHVARMRDTDESDVYRVIYVVPVPPSVAWNATLGIVDWVREASIVKDIEILTEMTEKGGGGKSEMQVRLWWSDGTAQEIGIRRDPQKGLIDLTVEPETRTVGRLAHCTVKIGPLRENSTIVEADIRIGNSFGRRLLGLILLPLGLAERVTKEVGLKKFWKQLASRHRAVSLQGLEPEGPVTGRTHIVAVGVDWLEGAEWQRLDYAEDDAKAFFAWATRTHHVPDGDERALIRKLLVGAEATDTQLGAILRRLNDRTGRWVREGDTILFFFAGHVEREEDILASGGHVAQTKRYLVTSNAERGNLRFSAVPLEDILAALRYSKASRCVFFFDGCYSGGRRVSFEQLAAEAYQWRGRRVPPDPGFQRLKRGPSKTVILAAAQEFNRAAERADLGHGVFTYVLLDGLGGAADRDTDGFVSIHELWEYIKARVPELTNSYQRPFVLMPCSERVAEIVWPVG